MLRHDHFNQAGWSEKRNKKEDGLPGAPDLSEPGGKSSTIPSCGQDPRRLPVYGSVAETVPNTLESWISISFL